MEKLAAGASVKRSSPAAKSSRNNKMKKGPVKVVYISNPKKIKASPSEFRAVVQLHTGRYASSSPSPSPSPYANPPAPRGIILNKDNNNNKEAAAAGGGYGGGGGSDSDLIIPNANYDDEYYYREDHDLIMSTIMYNPTTTTTTTDAALNYP